MKVRIWCPKHRRHHSAHEAFHCEHKACPAAVNARECPNGWLRK